MVTYRGSYLPGCHCYMDSCLEATRQQHLEKVMAEMGERERASLSLEVAELPGSLYRRQQ